MVKNLYVIFDCKNKTFGDIMSLENDEDAKRSFILSLINLPDVLGDDLALYRVGCIDVFNHVDEEVVLSASYPAVVSSISADCSYPVCTSRDVEQEVKQFRIRNAEMAKIVSQIHIDYSGKDFVENVRKLARYFSKKDKRFNK